MYLAVIAVKAVENYQLKLTFENNEIRIFDMKPYLDLKVFQPIKNPNIFKQVHIAFDTIMWKNSADLDPEILYSGSIPVNV